MGKEISIWNGYQVYGNVTELDNIVEANGLIRLEKEDIINTLSKNGKNYVAEGKDSNITDAFNIVLKDLPCKIENIKNLLINFQCGSLQPNAMELSNITSHLSANPEINIKWGLSSDSSLGESYKVILVASTDC